MADLGTWKSLAKIQIKDAGGLNRRSYIASVDVLTADTASGDQTTWQDVAGTSWTLRFAWDSAGIPLFGEATAAIVSVRLPGAGSDWATTWSIALSGASGVATHTLRLDSDPLAAAAGTNLHGALEVYITVQRTGVGPWGWIDSRGNGTPPASTSFDWARGKIRSNLRLATESISNVSFAGTEPNPFAFSDAIYTRLTFNADWYRSPSQSYTLRHSQSVVNVREETRTAIVTNYDFTWNQIATGDVNRGRVNADYNSVEAVDVQILLPALDFGGDNEFAWATGGHAGTYTKTTDRLLTSTGRFDVDPTITMTDLTFTDQVYTRGEVAPFKFKLRNARNESPACGALIDIRDSDNLVHDHAFSAAADGGGYFDFPDYEASARGKAPNDFVGERWNITTGYDDMAGLQVGGDIYKASRKAQVSTLGDGTINGSIFSAHTPNPSSDLSTDVVRCETIYFKGYLYTVRGTLWNHERTIWTGARPTSSEGFVTPSAPGGVTAAGVLTGLFKPSMDEPLGPKAVVFATEPTETGSQPRTGTGGNGGFAETSVAEIEVKESYINSTGQVISGGCAPCCDCPCTQFSCAPSHGSVCRAIGTGGAHRWWDVKFRPKRLLLVISGVTNGTCSNCALLNGEFVIILGSGNDYCAWISPNTLPLCATNPFGISLLPSEDGGSFIPTTYLRISNYASGGGQSYERFVDSEEFNFDCGDSTFTTVGSVLGGFCNFASASMIVRPIYKCAAIQEICEEIVAECVDGLCDRLPRRFVLDGSVVLKHSLNTYDRSWASTSAPLWVLDLRPPGPTETDHDLIRLTGPSAAKYVCHKNSFHCFGKTTFYNTTSGSPATRTIEPIC